MVEEALIVTLRNAVSASISECPRLARGMVTLVANLAANVKLPRTSRGHRRHKPELLTLRKVTIKAVEEDSMVGAVRN